MPFLITVGSIGFANSVISIANCVDHVSCPTVESGNCCNTIDCAFVVMVVDK